MDGQEATVLRPACDARLSVILVKRRRSDGSG